MSVSQRYRLGSAAKRCRWLLLSASERDADDDRTHPTHSLDAPLGCACGQLVVVRDGRLGGVHARRGGREFYAEARWSDCRADVARLDPGQGIFTFPPPYTAEGRREA